MTSTDSLSIEDVPKRYIKKIVKRNDQLQAQVRTVGKWPFRRHKMIITCNCGWQGRDDIPGAGMAELMMVTRYLARIEMDKHVIEEAIKLGWRPRKRY